MHSQSYCCLSGTAKDISRLEWKREWSGEDAICFNTEISSIRALREKHVEEAREWADNPDLRADNVRKACLSFPSKTAIGLDQHAFTDIALLPDNALDSLGEIVRQCFVKLAINLVTFAIVGLALKEERREQNNRHLTHHVWPHHAFGFSTHQSMGC